jgi:pyruvate carboxylase
VVPATGALPRDLEGALALAATLGYPLMLKASWGGGGRGMRVIPTAADLGPAMDIARREALAAFGNDEVYLEKLVRRARHVEVQILGDTQGQLVHLFERDCSVQRRNQKVVERAPAPYLTEARRIELCEAALRLARAAHYSHAGTVEFLVDADDDNFYFIEVNPRIQVEHTVTELVTGVDIVKAQIAITEGARLGDDDSHVPRQEAVRLNGHALQCRITTEDPENGFTPDYGRINAYRSPAGFGIRLDGGTAYSGAVITPYYDSLLVKVTAWGHSPRKRRGAWTGPCASSGCGGWPPTCPSWKTSSTTPSSCRGSAPPASSTRRRSCSSSASAATAPTACCVFWAISGSTATRR